MVKQISVFVENKPGRLLEMLKVLSAHNVDLKGFSLADTTEFGIARMIVSDVEAARVALTEEGVVFSTSNMLTVAIPDVPGALMGVLDVFAANEISVEYGYAFSQKLDGNSVIVLRTDQQELAEEKLVAAGVKVLSDTDIDNM